MKLSRHTAKTFPLAAAFTLATALAAAQDRNAALDSAAIAAYDTIRVGRATGRALENAVTVRGVITHAATGRPLPGISIRYKELSAAITDSTGAFSIRVPDTKVAITAGGSGYGQREIALRGRQTVAAGLYEEAYTSFYNPAYLPFGVQPLHRVPYAVTSVPTGGAWDRSFETPDAYLQGKVAGLQAVRRSGTPGAGAGLLLRGYTSLYATNKPLVVVDGVIYDINDYGSSLIAGQYTNPLALMDVRDIDHFTIIKDGSSVYGTKGANGVILITTARARDLGTRIDFAANGGINVAPRGLPLLDAAGYRTYLSGVLPTGGLTSEQIQALPYMNDHVNSPGYYQYHNNTDWQDQVLRHSYAQNLYLKVTGGDNIARYALSLGYLKNEGVVRNTDLSRYNTRFNADLNLSRRLTAVTNLSFAFNEQNARDQGMGAATSPLPAALTKAPILGVNAVSAAGIESPDLVDSDTFNKSNPVTLLTQTLGQNKSYRFLGSIGFNYAFSRNVSLSTTVGITVDKVRENIFIPSKGVVHDTLTTAAATNRSGAQVKRLFSLFNDTRLSYSKTFGRLHALSATAGFRYLQSNSEQDVGQGYNAATDELKSVSFGLSSLRRIGGNIGEWRWLNSYFQADYSYADKYFLNVGAALDGSSRFGRRIEGGAVKINKNQYAVLPSVAGAWLVSSESFMAGLPFIELLKLRASAGLSGNDDIGNYTARQYYVSQNLLGVQGLVRANFGNPGLQWEGVTRLNAGADLSLLGQRLNLTVDAYRSQTRRMLVNEPVATITGLVHAVTNSGGMKTEGLEASVTGRIINKAAFKWDAGFNIARYKSRITDLPSEVFETAFGGAATITWVNGAPNQFWGHSTTGIYATDAEAAQEGLSVRTAAGTLLPFRGGDVRFLDRNGDRVIDQYDRGVIGNPNPDFYGALTSRAEWQRWSVDLLFTFRRGGDVYNAVRNRLEALSGYDNQTAAVRNSWKRDGDVTTVPRAAWGDPMGNSRFSDRWIERGTYFRLRNATLSYNLTFPTGFLKYAVVYVTGNNLFTLTPYLGYDPEFSADESAFGQGIDQGLAPQARSFTAGVRFGL